MCVIFHCELQFAVNTYTTTTWQWENSTDQCLHFLFGMYNITYHLLIIKDKLLIIPHCEISHITEG